MPDPFDTAVQRELRARYERIAERGCLEDIRLIYGLAAKRVFYNAQERAVWINAKLKELEDFLNAKDAAARVSAMADEYDEIVSVEIKP